MTQAPAFNLTEAEIRKMETFPVHLDVAKSAFYNMFT